MTFDINNKTHNLLPFENLTMLLSIGHDAKTASAKSWKLRVISNMVEHNIVNIHPRKLSNNLHKQISSTNS